MEGLNFNEMLNEFLGEEPDPDDGFRQGFGGSRERLLIEGMVYCVDLTRQ